MRNLLLITHKAVDGGGGAVARWRSLVRRLPDYGWHVTVVAAPMRPSATEFGSDEVSRARATRRAALMGQLGRVSSPLFRTLRVRPDVLPLSMAWVVRGSAATRRAIRELAPDAIVATGPPMVSLLVARFGVRDCRVPVVMELRDLWAGNPLFDYDSPLLQAVESKLLCRANAVVACTPQAASDLRRRHPRLTSNIHYIPNGFEPELLPRRTTMPEIGAPLTILHSGTLTADRPLAPLLTALSEEPFQSRFRLVLHGFVSPANRSELIRTARDIDVEVIAPSDWSSAIDRIAAADVALISQGKSVGDQTAIAGKVYEYLALGKPILCVSDGGATEELLRSLGAEAFCCRLDSVQSIRQALDRLLQTPFTPVSEQPLRQFSRDSIAQSMAELLDQLIYDTNAGVTASGYF